MSVSLLVPGALQAEETPARSSPSAPAPAPVSKARSGLETLIGMMEGSFTSAGQAAKDPEYRDIRLEMKRIWATRTDGVWLYVEQAVATALEKPYRQRVYQVVQTSPTTYESRVFTLPDDPLRFAGGFRDETKFSALTPDKLAARAGCTVHLEPKPEGGFGGATQGKGCASDLRGASHATSEVRITHDGIDSWDRGFDGEGRQVWGAEKGPYLFRRH